LQIGLGRRPVLFLSCLRVHPADAVEALLEHIVRPRHQVLVFPTPQTLAAPEGVDGGGGPHLRLDWISRPVHRAADAVRGCPFQLGLFHLLGTRILDDLDPEGFGCLFRDQAGNGPRLLADDPGGGEWHPPAGCGVGRLDAVEVIVGLPTLAFDFARGLVLPALVVPFDSPRLDLAACRLVNLLLGLLNLFRRFRAAANEVDGGPGQKRADRVQVRAVNVATQNRGLEGDAAAAAEGVADAGSVAEAPLAQFMDQFREAVRLRSQMRVDRLPGRLRGAGDLFGAHAIGKLPVVAHAVEGPVLHVFPIFPGRRPLPLPFSILADEIELPFRLCGEFIDIGGGDVPPQTVPEPLLVHGQEFEENLAVLFRISGGRQEQSQEGRPDQDQGLAAPPLAQAREGLAVVGLALLVAFLGKQAYGKLGFDEG